MSAVLGAISNIMAKVGSVSKEGVNTFHKYKFAAISTVLEKVQPLMAEEGLIILQSERDLTLVDDGNVLRVTYEFSLMHKSGEYLMGEPDKDGNSILFRVLHTGLCSARNSKGGFDDKASNKCHTSARKYFILALFQIPTVEMDSIDADKQEDQPALKRPANDNDMDAPEPAKAKARIVRQPAPVVPVGTAPYAIQVGTLQDGSIDYIGWCRAFMLQVNTAKTALAISDWASANQATLKTIESDFDKVSRQLKSQMKDATDRLHQQKISALAADTLAA